MTPATCLKPYSLVWKRNNSIYNIERDGGEAVSTKKNDEDVKKILTGAVIMSQGPEPLEFDRAAVR